MSEKIGAGGKYQEFNTANGQYEKESKGENTAIEDTDFFSGEEKGEAKEDFFEEKGIENKKKMTPAEKTVEIDLNSDFQKRLNNAATPKERQEIAFRYIMDNLRGKYTADDGRTVAIERVGASKMTFVDRVDKLRVCPALANMIKVGKYDHSAKGEDKPNKKFEEFAYYRVRIKIGNDIYNAMLNVGIRKDGSSTLYDLCPFDKQNK